MNKAFVREPESDGRGYCPRCGSLGTEVGGVVLDRHVLPAVRPVFGDKAWFCGYARCGVAYFDVFDTVVGTDQLRAAIYPKDPQASLCPCFGFSIDEIEADAQEEIPHRIRALAARAKSSEARCHELAPDGQCCLREIQRLYFKRKPV